MMTIRRTPLFRPLPRSGASRVVIVAGLALLLACGPVFAQSAAGDAGALRTYFGANGMLNRGLYDLAVTEYRAFLAQAPDHEKADVAHYGLGVSLFRLGRHREAVEAIDGLRQRGDFTYAAEVGTILGQCHLALDEPETAADRFREVVERHGGHALADDAAALLVESQHYAGRYAEVAEPARRFVAQWPDSPLRERVELFQGLAEMAQGDYATSAERFGGLLERFPDGAHADQATLLHAQSLHRVNAPQPAIDRYRQVLAQAHDTYVPEAMYGLALLLYQQDQARAAATLLDEMADRFPKHDLAPAVRVLRGRLWLDAGELDKARTEYAKVPADDRDYGDDATYWTAKCDLRAGDAKRGASRLEDAIERFPKSELMPEMMYDHAVALTRLEQPDAALARLEAFRRRFPKHALAPDALHLAASTEHQRRGYDASLSICRTFLESYPQHALAPAIAFMAAENAFLAHDYDTAAGRYRAFLESHPKDAQAAAATYRLGMSLYQMREYDAAEPLLTQSAARRKKSEVFRPALLAVGDMHFQAGRWASAETYFADYLEFGLDQPSADDALLKLGLSHHRQDEPAEALAAYDRLIAGFPKSHQPQVAFERGQALMSLGRLDEAREVFTRIARDETTSRFAMHALNHLGAIAIGEGDYDAAAKHFALVSGRKDADRDILATALARQGESHFAAGAFDEAREAFTKLLERYPDSSHAPKAEAQLAIACARRDDPAGALKVMKGMSAAHRGALDAETRASLTYEQAWCLRALDRPEEAIAAYTTLLRESGATELARHGMLELAELEAGAGRRDQAERHLAQLLEIDDAPETLRSQAMYRFGVCAYEGGRHREAADRLAGFLAAYPQSPLAASAHLLAGESFFRTGAHQRAAQHLARVAAGDPASPSCGPALLRLGECHAALQDWRESERAFALYLERFGSTDLAYQAQFGVGWAQENQGNRDAAVVSYRKVVESHDGPTAARAQFQIGECLYADKRYEDAARELLKVDILYGYPQWSGAALYEAARCFRELGDPVQARTLFEQVTREHGNTQWSALAADRLKEMSRSGLPGH